MKKSFTWWVGWVALAPLRAIFLLALLPSLIIHPSGFYSLLNMQWEKDQEKWK